jgi:H+/Cl- antiporter ClcA
MVIATAIGISCGVAAYLYYEGLWGLLEFLWKTIPEKYVIGVWPEWAYPFYIPLMGYAMSLLVGLSVKFLGDPGDLAHVIECVHEKGYIAIDHSLPMICASQFSILGGGSLGPEAPLVAIAAAISGFISRSVFHNCNRNIVRKHTLMGMAGALAAFFGCPLGGSLFALEVTSRLGMEYYEHAIEAIFCGEITLAVFRFGKLQRRSLMERSHMKSFSVSSLDCWEV